VVVVDGILVGLEKKRGVWLVAHKLTISPELCIEIPENGRKP